MNLWVNMVPVIQVNALLTVSSAPSVIHNKPARYFMRKKRAL